MFKTKVVRKLNSTERHHLWLFTIKSQKHLLVFLLIPGEVKPFLCVRISYWSRASLLTCGETKIVKRSLRVGKGMGPTTWAPVRFAVSTISPTEFSIRLWSKDFKRRKKSNRKKYKYWTRKYQKIINYGCILLKWW